MGNENEFEFVPLAPITHNSLPEEMREFISSCGMMGIMPRRGFQGPGHGVMGQVIDLKSVEDGMEIEKALEGNFNSKDDTVEYMRFRDVELKEDNSYDDERVENVLKGIETNNAGIFKFLQVNGMPYDKAKKFIRRVIRLSLRYDE